MSFVLVIVFLSPKTLISFLISSILIFSYVGNLLVIRRHLILATPPPYFFFIAHVSAPCMINSFTIVLYTCAFYLIGICSWYIIPLILLLPLAILPVSLYPDHHPPAAMQLLKYLKAVASSSYNPPSVFWGVY